MVKWQRFLGPPFFTRFSREWALGSLAWQACLLAYLPACLKQKTRILVPVEENKASLRVPAPVSLVCLVCVCVCVCGARALSLSFSFSLSLYSCLSLYLCMYIIDTCVYVWYVV